MQSAHHTTVSLASIIIASAIIMLLAAYVVCINRAFGEHTKEISLTSADSNFFPLSTGTGNQVRVSVNYYVHDSSLDGKIINALMKVYDMNDRLIKTTSYPNGFPVESPDGTAQLKTTLTNTSISLIKASIVFTNQEKTVLVSNELSVGRVHLGDQRHVGMEEIVDNNEVKEDKKLVTPKGEELQQSQTKSLADPKDNEQEDMIEEEEDEDDRNDESISPKDLLPSKLLT